MTALCVLLPLENLLWAKLRDYTVSRVKHVNIVGTQCCDNLSRTCEDLTRELDRGFQIGVIRVIRMDHTDFFQVDIKTHSFYVTLALSINNKQNTI